MYTIIIGVLVENVAHILISPINPKLSLTLTARCKAGRLIIQRINEHCFLNTRARQKVSIFAIVSNLIFLSCQFRVLFRQRYNHLHHASRLNDFQVLYLYRQAFQHRPYLCLKLKKIDIDISSFLHPKTIYSRGLALYGIIFSSETTLHMSSIISTMDIEVFRLAIELQTVCVVQSLAVTLHHPQFCVTYSTPTGSILFKQHFHKSCKAYQLTNQC